MMFAEPPAPLTRSKRWAKHAAERDQQIQSEAIAIKVLLPDMPDEDIRNCLKEHGGQTDLVLQKLLDAQEANLLGGVLDDATSSGAPASPHAVSLEPVHSGDLPEPTVKAREASQAIEEPSTSMPSTRSANDAPSSQPTSGVPQWLPMLQPSTPAQLSKCQSQLPYTSPAGLLNLLTRRKVQYDRQTERLKAASVASVSA